jgi:hypothetical protein
MAGTKNDQGKAPFHLLSGPALWAVAEVLEYGRQKYAARNWEDGISYSRLFAALQRHLWEWWSGVKRDDESGLHALAHAMCDIMFLLHYELRYEGALERSKFHPDSTVRHANWCMSNTYQPLDDRPLFHDIALPEQTRAVKGSAAPAGGGADDVGAAAESGGAGAAAAELLPVTRSFVMGVDFTSVAAFDSWVGTLKPTAERQYYELRSRLDPDWRCRRSVAPAAEEENK